MCVQARIFEHFIGKRPSNVKWFSVSFIVEIGTFLSSRKVGDLSPVRCRSISRQSCAISHDCCCCTGFAHESQKYPAATWRHHFHARPGNVMERFSEEHCLTDMSFVPRINAFDLILCSHFSLSVLQCKKLTFWMLLSSNAMLSNLGTLAWTAGSSTSKMKSAPSNEI
jgi:hypothetical protein